MQIRSILAMLCLANAAAGAAAVAAFWAPSMLVTASVSGAAVLIAIAISGGGILKIHNALIQMQDSVAKNVPLSQTGIAEFDGLGQQFATLIEAAQREAVVDTSELEEIKRLLAKVDRRQGAFDRDGQPISCATQLQSILKGYGGELDTNIRQTISCGREIRRATEEMVSGSEAQSDAVSQTTAFVEQLSSRTISICDHAQTALTSSAKARENAETGLQQFGELIDEMKQIRNHAAARERKLQALGQHTKEIESIVQTIGTLSSRTDLLALNASIESVRAGEHGRGFAVVAEEVRALAEQSAQSVLDISRRIEMIQLETHQSISVASGEHDQMHQVIKRVSESVNQLREILESAESSAAGLTEISNETHQQLQLTGEMIASLERNAETSKRNRSRAEGAHWTAKTLSQVSSQLDNSLELFRLSGALPPVEHYTGAPQAPAVSQSR